ncbi:hypothetical protein EJ05DRAFT_48360 [Pseudovirgaria hyperparasitica]|uniref:Mis12-domain-containing protein n=1 Tax=Pseudovirgaria hyperparasitica TaxID=470096 RepID=A0A6A6W4T9_9PEZI|nr:uncharacterized protein EJ05DRAFT_48360 [Pseudovirgaria hyperparasitica]KAF2756940.1 hypothetical protein EJ05DRAFT_48360 [Pseudovirgaria hyperparasitica]
MATPKQIQASFLTEHFGWTPISFIDEVINSINVIITQGTDSIEQALLSADAGRDLGWSAKAASNNQIPDTETGEDGVTKEVFGDDPKNEIEEGVLKLETLLENTVDKNFDKWEIWVLRNVLSLGKDWEGSEGWIRLKGYENLHLPTSTTLEDQAPTPESLMSLRRKLQETQKLHTLLLAEKARNHAVLTQLNPLLTPQSQPPKTSPLPKQEPKSSTSPLNPTKLTDARPDFSFITTQQPGSLQSNTTFPLTQLPLLRKHLDALRPYLKGLPAEPGLPRTEAGMRARERSEYVEAQTRRILERRGVDVQGGVGGGLGRRVAPDEVRALEQVVDILGRNRSEEEEEEHHPQDKMDLDE